MDFDGDVGTPIARIDLYLDSETTPFQSIVPPAHVDIDTDKLPDGPHELRMEAYDALGNVGRRAIPFVVQNGPGITVTGLRAGERVGGNLGLELNAFSGKEPFDPVRAESGNRVPVWTWVLVVLVTAWAGWYALEYTAVPAAFAATPTYEENPIALAAAPAAPAAAPAAGAGATAGFDYQTAGEQLYTQNCAACHGASGAGVPGAFPPLAADPVVTASDPTPHIKVVLHGLSKVPIKGTSYGSQMPPFTQLSDHDIAAIIDHERTSWGNSAPTITPDQVKKAR